MRLLISKISEAGFVKPFVLSFSASRYGSSSFGDYIRKARLEKGLRQKDLAENIRVDEQTIVNWENAEVMPKHNYTKVKEACEVFDINYEEVLRNFHSLWKSDDIGLGTELIKARIRSGLRQEDVAKKAGIDPTTLRRWE